MTVGQELEKRTNFRLFHNHMTIEIVAPFFSYGQPDGRRLVRRLREAFFDAFAAHPEKNYIFTYVWAFDEPGERDYIEGITETFGQGGHTVFWVELEATLEERLRRNRTENRLHHKPSKRDLDWSEQNLLDSGQDHRQNSEPGEITFANYLRVNTTDLSATQVAMQIARHFDLETHQPSA